MKLDSNRNNPAVLDMLDRPGAAGADLAPPDTIAVLGAARCNATIIKGGLCILAFSGAETPPPATAPMRDGAGVATWRAVCWSNAEGHWCGLALLERLPIGEILIEDNLIDADPLVEREPADATPAWRCPAPARVDVDPLALATFAIETGADGATLLGFCATHLVGAGDAAPRAHQAFAVAFLTAAAAPDGFVEIVATPEGHGAFLQGWSMGLAAGAARFAIAGVDIAFTGVEVTRFGRDDILPPGAGFCAYSKDRAVIADVKAVFFENGERLLRLDVPREGPVQLSDHTAVEHIRRFAHRLSGPEATLRAFRRICRPRFAGADTLSLTTLPVAAALDAVLRAPDGGLLVTGWLLDPTHLVERAILRGAGGRHAPLHGDWIALPRPDLIDAFSRDPRFVNLLSEKEAMHGFVCHAPAHEENGAQAANGIVNDEELYLELVLRDESCLFLPVASTTMETVDHRLGVLSGLGQDNPDLETIVRQHLAPFFRGVRPSAATAVRRTNPPTPLGAEAAPRPVSAVMPFERLADIQPVFSALMSKPEAGMLDLVLIASRQTASETLEALRQTFDFYGLSGRLVVVSESWNAAERLEAGVAASSAPHVLAWNPCVLPRTEGWLGKMLAEAGRTMGLITPTLLYEDGSVYFGGGASGSAPGSASRFAGYSEHWLDDGPATPVTVGAAELVLAPRQLLAKVGGFAGRLFTDAYIHVDLAARAAEIGTLSYWLPGVTFWMLDDLAAHAASNTTSNATALMRRVDAVLIASRAAAQGISS